MTDLTARLTAAIIATAALLAMLPPLANAMAEHGGWLAGIWHLLRFFTITTNSLVALVFARIAWRGREAVSPTLLGGTILAIVLVGVVFNLLLGGLEHRTVWDTLGDHVHHIAIPLAVPAWWLAFARKGALGWSDPLRWMGYPLAYTAYVLARAPFDPPLAFNGSRYPYFFMAVDQLGWVVALANMAAIAAGFALAGFAVVWIDRRLGR
jgi:hypothetical protein